MLHAIQWMKGPSDPCVESTAQKAVQCHNLAREQESIAPIPGSLWYAL